MKSKASDYKNLSILHLLSVGTVGETYTPINSAGALALLGAAASVRIKAGGNAEDDATEGDGARFVLVRGLDADYNPIEESLFPAGEDASAASSQTFLRVNEVLVTQVGTAGGSNADDIEIETTGDDSLAVILAGEGRATLGHYTIPAGKRGLLWYAQVSNSEGDAILARLMATGNLGDVPVFAPAHILYQSIQDRQVWDLRSPVVIDEMTDLSWEGLIDSGTGQVVVDWELELIEKIV